MEIENSVFTENRKIEISQSKHTSSDIPSDMNIGAVEYYYSKQAGKNKLITIISID